MRELLYDDEGRLRSVDEVDPDTPFLPGEPNGPDKVFGMHADAKPWMLTQRQFQEREAETFAGGVPVLNVDDAREHECIVREALEQGHPVPDCVLADYPDLAEAEKASKRRGIPSGSLRIVYLDDVPDGIIWTGDTRSFQQYSERSEGLRQAFDFLNAVKGYVKAAYKCRVVAIQKDFGKGVHARVEPAKTGSERLQIEGWEGFNLSLTPSSDLIGELDYIIRNCYAEPGVPDDWNAPGLHLAQHIRELIRQAHTALQERDGKVFWTELWTEFGELSQTDELLSQVEKVWLWSRKRFLESMDVEVTRRESWQYREPDERRLAKKYRGNRDNLMVALAKAKNETRRNDVLSELADLDALPDEYVPPELKPGNGMAVGRLKAFYEERQEVRPSPVSRKRGWALLTYLAPKDVQCVGCGREPGELPELQWLAYRDELEGDTFTWACPACWNGARLPDLTPAPASMIDPVELPKPPSPRLEPGSPKSVERLYAFYDEHPKSRESGYRGWVRRLTGTLSISNAWCVGCGQHIQDSDLRRVSEPAFEYFFEDRADGPRCAACWPCWSGADLPDFSETNHELANLYRDYLSVTNGDESAHPSAETLVKYQRWAQELVVGGEREREGAKFRRFCRVSLVARKRGFDLGAVGESYERGRDFSALEGWACLRETDEHFYNRSWEAGWKPLYPCARCGREPGPDDKAQEVGGWSRLCGKPVYLCPGCNQDLLAWKDGQIEEAKAVAAENKRALRQAKAAAKKEAKQAAPTDQPQEEKEADEITRTVSASLLEKAEKSYSANIITSENRIKRPFSMPSPLDDLWVCTGMVTGSSHQAECRQVVLLEEYEGDDTWRAEEKHEWGKGYTGRIVRYGKKKEYVITGRKLVLTLSPDEPTTEETQVSEAGGEPDEQANGLPDLAATHLREKHILQPGGNERHPTWQDDVIYLSGPWPVSTDSDQMQGGWNPNYLTEDYGPLPFMQDGEVITADTAERCVEMLKAYLAACGQQTEIVLQTEVEATEESRAAPANDVASAPDTENKEPAARKTKSELPDDISEVIEVDLGHTHGWATATALRVRGKWLCYRLDDEMKADKHKGKVQVYGRDIIWRVPIA